MFLRVMGTTLGRASTLVHQAITRVEEENHLIGFELPGYRFPIAADGTLAVGGYKSFAHGVAHQPSHLVNIELLHQLRAVCLYCFD